MGLRERIAAGHIEPVADPDEVSIDQMSVAFIRRRLVEEVNLGELSQLSPSQRRARLERTVGQILSSDGPVLSTNQRSALIRQIVDESIGLGVLEPLLADETITEIMVNGHDEVWVERAGIGLERQATKFRDEIQLLQTIDRIVSTVNRRVDESSPMVDARLPTGERVNVIIPPLALGGPTLTIRRFPRLYTLDEIVDHGSLDGPMADLLRAFVRAKLNIIVSGGTGAGKTTMLNALSASIPGSERIITIEDSAELKLQQPHVVALEGRPSNVEGRGAVTIRDLVRNSLRMRPDRIVVGEVRGAETLDMLQAMNTGHEGSLSTVHANSAEDAVSRLETLASMSDVKIPYEALRDQINCAIDIVVQLERGVNDRRRVVEIATISSKRREPFLLTTVASFEPDPLGPGRVVTGTLPALPAARARAAAPRAARRGPSGGVHRRRRRERGPPARGRLMDALGLLLLVVGPRRRARGHVARRLRSRAAGVARGAQRGDVAAEFRRPLRLRLDDALRRTPRGQRLAASLASAGVTLRPIDFAAAALGGRAADASLLVNTLFPLWLSIVAGAFAVRCTGTWVDWQREKRKQAFVAQLPEIARVLSNGAGAGLVADGGARPRRARARRAGVDGARSRARADALRRAARRRDDEPRAAPAVARARGARDDARDPAAPRRRRRARAAGHGVDARRAQRPHPRDQDRRLGHGLHGVARRRHGDRVHAAPQPHEPRRAGQDGHLAVRDRGARRSRAPSTASRSSSSGARCGSTYEPRAAGVRARAVLRRRR